jgi:tripartite-type tricarboxylate transporter receptor subunit TctC
MVGLFAPVGTPPGALDRLNTEINKILSSREIRDVAKIMFADTAPMSRAEFAKFYRGELDRYKDLLIARCGHQSKRNIKGASLRARRVKKTPAQSR